MGVGVGGVEGQTLKARHTSWHLNPTRSLTPPLHSPPPPQVPDSAKGYLGYVLSHAGDAAILPLIEAAVEARTELAPALRKSRETLYLDLALENMIRAAAERGAGASGTAAATLIGPLLQNLALSTGDNEEVCYCLQGWQELPAAVRAGRHPSKDEALKVGGVCVGVWVCGCELGGVGWGARHRVGTYVAGSPGRL